MKALLLIVLSLLAIPLAGAEMREWKTADKSKTLVAEYVSSLDGKVTIRRKRDRRTFTLSLDMLSEEDREYVKQKEEEASGDGSGEAKDADGEFAKLITGDWERAEGHGSTGFMARANCDAARERAIPWWSISTAEVAM